MGQAQSGTEPAGGSLHAEPSRHVKVPDDQLIPAHSVIDDQDMLHAVQRRIGRGVLAPF
jgi:hypothetical protein